MVAGVADGLEQGILWWARHVISHGIAPSPEGLDKRPGMLSAPEQLLPAAELLAADLLLLGIKTADEIECPVAANRVEIPDLHKLTSGVTPTAGVDHRLWTPPMMQAFVGWVWCMWSGAVVYPAS